MGVKVKTFKTYNLVKFCIIICLASHHLSSISQEKFSMRCQFKVGNSAEYTSSDIKMKRLPGNDMAPLIFDQISIKNSSGRLISNAGTNDVFVLSGRVGSIHLLETTAFGNLNITTVFNISKISVSNSVEAVHSRHNAFPEGAKTSPLPSQYYGSCTAMP
jgi:hypothetical protein